MAAIKERGRSIWLIDDFPLYPDAKLIIEWHKLLAEDFGTKHQRHTLLKSCKGLFLSIFGPASPRGISYSPSTMLLGFSRLKRIVGWMNKRSIWRFCDLEPSDLIELCRSVAPRDGSRVSEATLRYYLRFFNEMWELRTLYCHPLRFDPSRVEDEVFARVPTRGNHSWEALPDEIAFALLSDALTWIRGFGPVVQQLTLEAAKRFEKNVGKTKKERSKLSRLFYEDIEKRPEFIRLAQSLAFKGPAYKVLSVALSITEGACVFLLLMLVGFRASEAVALNVDCMETETADPGGQFGYLSGVAAKDNGRRRRWVAGDPVPEVVALLASLSSYARERGLTTSKALLLNRAPGAPCFLPSRKSGRWVATTLTKRVEMFCTAGLREGAVQAERFHPHMARKTFAQLAVRRDRRNLEAVSAHLGHVYRSFTDQVYVGIDHELAELLDAEDRSELARQLEHLLTCDQVFGRAAPLLENLRSEVKRFRGRHDLTRLIDDLIKKGVKLAPCDWGYCVYSKAHAACGGDAGGPNEVGRSPEVCSTCTNFSVTEVHLPWWSDRADREERFLMQPGLPEQTRLYAEKRLSNTRSVLAKVIRIVSTEGQDEKQRF